MNKKLKVLFSLALLLSKEVFAHENETQCEPCKEVNVFCGGYVGANFNFGSVNFLSTQEVKTEVANQTAIYPQLSFSLAEDTRKDSCLREALNTVGGGVTLGWAWANSCWYLAAEFNGLFYGNPSSNISNDCCDTECKTKCCGYASSIDRRTHANNSEEWVDVEKIIYGHNYKNNVRLDGVAKVGFLSNPNTAFYLLGGGSGLLVQYSNSINHTEEVSDAINIYSPPLNDVNNSFCCNKWIGGGTIGAGLRSTWCDCFDVVLEARYARYANTCFSNNKVNDVSDEFQPNPNIPPAEFAEEDSTKFRTDSYLALVGINWRF